MDVNKILKSLRQERSQIEETISSLEGPRRRGCAPAWLRRGRTPGGSGSGGSGGSLPTLPTHLPPRLEDIPTRRRPTPTNLDLKRRTL